MFNIPSGIIKEVKSSKHLRRINSIENQVNINNLIDKINSKNIEYNNNSDLYINKPQRNIELKKYKNKNTKTPKTPFISSKKNLISINKNQKNTILYNDNDVHQFLKKNGTKSSNMFIKDSKNKKIAKSYISPTYDYNIKNSHKSNICLNLKNNNSNPIKLKNEDYSNINTNKNSKYISNSSINYKSSSLYATNYSSNIEKTLKNNTINSKRPKIRKNLNDIKTNKRKYISYTPDCNRNAVFIRNKSKNDELNKKMKEKENKEVVRMIFEKQFKDRMIFGLKAKNNSNNSLLISYSRNKLENAKVLNSSHNQSQKNIFKYESKINKKKEIHKYNTINVDKNYNNKKNNYKQYYLLLKKKIKILNSEIEKIKEEEKTLILELVNYKEKENECNYIRQLREEIKKYKTIIEKTDKTCEEYSQEISKIKNII
jgi:hypothetical protein